jgi:hypothetical protein
MDSGLVSSFVDVLWQSNIPLATVHLFYKLMTQCKYSFFSNQLSGKTTALLDASCYFLTERDLSKGRETF